MMKLCVHTLVALVLSSLATISSAQTWRLASIEWPPYAGADLEAQGSALQALKKILSAHNITLEVDFLPWNRAVAHAKKGRYIGYFPAWPEEVQAGFVPSSAIEMSSVALLSYRGSAIEWTSLEQTLEHRSIGVVSSYVYSKEIDKVLKKNRYNIHYVPDDKTLIRVLANKRVALALTDPRLMKYYSKQDNHHNLTVVKSALVVKPLVIALTNSAENAEVIAQLKQWLNQ